MEFIKNLLAMLLATVVWLSSILATASLWWGIKDQDIWYLYPLGILLAIMVAAFIGAKYNLRFRTALEHPLELWGL
jgi:membrane protein YdbS with pleckstrin-like domain